MLSEKIYELRKRAGLSQEELADKLNVSRQAVSKWETGVCTPDVENIVEMSRLFGVPTDTLLQSYAQDPLPQAAACPPQSVSLALPMISKSTIGKVGRGLLFYLALVMTCMGIFGVALGFVIRSFPVAAPTQSNFPDSFLPENNLVENATTQMVQMRNTASTVFIALFAVVLAIGIVLFIVYMIKHKKAVAASADSQQSDR